MAGILDPKSRIQDIVITDIGRQLLSRGEFVPIYISFTDSGAVYETTSSVTHRPVFEASSTSQFDRILFDANDDGTVEFSDGKLLTITCGKLFSSSANTTLVVTGTQFVSQSLGLMSASLDSMQKQMLIRTSDHVYEQNTFNIDTTQLDFHMTDGTIKGIQKLTVDHALSIFQDRRFTGLANFLYLPPVNRRSLGGTSLGNFPSLSQPMLTYDELRQQLSTYEKKTIEMLNTSHDGNIVCQMFEVAENSMRLMDVLHFGHFNVISNAGDLTAVNVFFVGKTYYDAYGSPTFINIFTVILE